MCVSIIGGRGLLEAAGKLGWRELHRGQRFSSELLDTGGAGGAEVEMPGHGRFGGGTKGRDSSEGIGEGASLGASLRLIRDLTLG